MIPINVLSKKIQDKGMLAKSRMLNNHVQLYQKEMQFLHKGCLGLSDGGVFKLSKGVCYGCAPGQVDRLDLQFFPLIIRSYINVKGPVKWIKD